MDNAIGIDVSKDTLDVHRLTDDQHKQFNNGKIGHTHTQLLKWISLQPDPLIIFEATGAYHRRLEQTLSTKKRRIRERESKVGSLIFSGLRDAGKVRLC